MKLISATAAAVLLCFGTAVAAEPGSSANPMQKAENTLQGNIKKNPDSTGLKGALRQIRTNIRRFEAKQNDKPHLVDRAHNAERTEHTEAVGAQHAGLAERVERAERPERVERVEADIVLDRPGRSENARGRR